MPQYHPPKPLRWMGWYRDNREKRNRWIAVPNSLTYTKNETEHLLFSRLMLKFGDRRLNTETGLFKDVSSGIWPDDETPSKGKL